MRPDEGQNGRGLLGRLALTPGMRRWLPLVAVLLLLGVGAAAATMSGPGITRLPPPREEAPTVGQGDNGDPLPSREPLDVFDEKQAEAVGTLPTWLAYGAAALCVLVMIVVIAVVIWYLVRNSFSVHKGALPVEAAAGKQMRNRQDVVAAVDEGLSALSHADRDARRVVIACWVRLEQAAAAAGTPRQIGDTPTDLVLRLLRGHRVDRRVLDRFASIYREARYATHVVDESMRTEAQAALRQLRAELTAPAGLAT